MRMRLLLLLLLAFSVLCVSAFSVSVASPATHSTSSKSQVQHVQNAQRVAHICTSYCALLVDPWFSGDSFWCGPAHYGDVIFLWGGSVWVCDRSAYYNGASHVHYYWANPIPAPDGAHWYDFN